jgi:hypothetical protein
VQVSDDLSMKALCSAESNAIIRSGFEAAHSGVGQARHDRNRNDRKALEH